MSATSTKLQSTNTEYCSVSMPVGASMRDEASSAAIESHHNATTAQRVQAPKAGSPNGSGTPIADAYRAAILRARDEGLSAQRNADGTWTCKEYTVQFVGPRWSDLTCTCKGSNHKACKHRAIVIFGRKYGASRVAFKAKEVASPAIAAAVVQPCQHDIFAYLEEGTACAQCGVWLAAPLSVRFNTIDPERLAAALRAAEAAHTIAESTPAEVAQSQAIAAEVIAEMAEYPRGSRADIARCDATADYYEEVARANAAAYAAATTAPPSRDPLDDCYGTIAVETYMHAGYAA